jgi:hypothetical protein
MKKSTIERLERQLKESVKGVPVPMGVNVDPDTFSGPAPIKMEKGACGCSCEACRGCKAKMEGAGGGCGCGCGGKNESKNTKPVKMYVFTGEAAKGSDAALPLGYSQTKFLSLLQSMVAPLPVVNKPGMISVIASPALEKGLGALAAKEGMKMSIIAQKTNEGSCS